MPELQRSGLNQFIDWLDDRTGSRRVVREVLYENIPGGSRWRYVWGSTLMFTLMVQFITGIVLWMAYSPSTQTAWESVYYIQYEMTGGWFLRGLHHWTAQLMTVLLVLHLMQVVIDGAYKSPREINFWFGIVLLLLVLGLSLTGYLLPWDQKGYWATSVATDILASTPLIGEWLKQVVIGGNDYGHHTLTRFFALHAGILPGAIITLTVGHIYLFRRHGIKVKKPHRTKDEFFWPEQVLKDGVACLAVLSTVLFFVIRQHGAHLDAPADPSSSYQARPDWYFLWLFQLLKYVPEFVGAFVVPGLVMALLVLMPIFGKWKLGHGFNVVLLLVVTLGASVLTFLAIDQDRTDQQYQSDMVHAVADAELVKRLAKEQGIPPEGALFLLRAQENTGPKLFAKYCASCHAYGGEDGLGNELASEQSAADLKGFASREYLAELLHPERFASSKFFGNTEHVTRNEDNSVNGKMVYQLTKLQAAIEEGEFEEEEFDRLLDVLSAEVEIPGQKQDDVKAREELIKEGTLLLEDLGCADCHIFHRTGVPNAPDLTGYGSREWMLGFIRDPSHDRFYGASNDRMPAFGKAGELTNQQIEAIVDWLLGNRE